MSTTIHIVMLHGEIAATLGETKEAKVEVHDLDQFSDPEWELGIRFWDELAKRHPVWSPQNDTYDNVVEWLQSSGYDLREVDQETLREMADKYFAAWQETSQAVVSSSMPMVTAYNLGRATKALVAAERIAKSEMPKGEFVFVGLDNDFVYFNVVARVHLIDEDQIRDLKQKTPFHPLEERMNPVYIGKFKMSL